MSVACDSAIDVPFDSRAVVAPSQRWSVTHRRPRTLSKEWFSWNRMTTCLMGAVGSITLEAAAEAGRGAAPPVDKAAKLPMIRAPIPSRQATRTSRTAEVMVPPRRNGPVCWTHVRQGSLPAAPGAHNPLVGDPGRSSGRAPDPTAVRA
jgi:hypothetical protein